MSCQGPEDTDRPPSPKPIHLHLGPPSLPIHSSGLHFSPPYGLPCPPTAQDPISPPRGALPPTHRPGPHFHLHNLRSWLGQWDGPCCQALHCRPQEGPVPAEPWPWDNGRCLFFSPTAIQHVCNLSLRFMH